MNSCQDCKYFRHYAGSKDRYGVPQEPDDYECKNIENITEEECDKYFCNGDTWSSSESGCSGYEMADWEY